MIQSSVLPSSTATSPSIVEQKQQPSSAHVDPPSLASTGTFTVRDVEEEATEGESGEEYDSQAEDDGAGPDQLASNGEAPEGSPVQAVWLNPPKVAQHPSAAVSAAASSAPSGSPATSESKRAVDQPLISYDLNSSSLRPSATATPTSPSFSSSRPTVEAKRLMDQQREHRLMQMEHQTQMRKVHIRRSQQQADAK